VRLGFDGLKTLAVPTVNLDLDVILDVDLVLDHQLRFTQQLSLKTTGSRSTSKSRRGPGPSQDQRVSSNFASRADPPLALSQSVFSKPCRLTTRIRAGMMRVFCTGAHHADAMLRLWKDPSFRPDHFARSQRAPEKILPQPAERQDFGKGFGQAGSRLHPLSEIRKDQEGHLGERYGLDFHQHLPRQARDLHG